MPPQNQPPEYQSSEQLPTQDYTFPPQDRLRTPVGFDAPPQGQTQPQPQAQFQPQFRPQFRPQAQPQGEGQPQVSRRSLLRGGLIGGGIGLAVAAGAGAAVAITRDSSQTSLKPVSKPVVMAPMAPGAMEGPLVVYISDTTTGVLDVFAGTGATQIHNPALVTQLLDNLK
jgi:hypothetical protein